MPIAKRPIGPTPAGQPARQVPAAPAQQAAQQAGVPAGLRRVANADPKMGPAPGGVTPGEPMSFKTHALIGRRESDGHLLLIESWPHCPTKDELEKAKKGTKYPYVQFALMNTTGVWDTVEAPVKPIWTARF